MGGLNFPSEKFSSHIYHEHCDLGRAESFCFVFFFLLFFSFTKVREMRLGTDLDWAWSMEHGAFGTNLPLLKFSTSVSLSVGVGGGAVT